MKILPKLFIALLVVFLVPMLLLLYIFYGDIKEISLDNLLKDQIQKIELQEIIISNLLVDSKSEILFLSKISSLGGLLDAKSDDEYNRAVTVVASDFMSFSKERGVYYQIRYIDISGDEIVRIDYDGNEFYNIGADELQNKIDRYYFEDTASLSEGEVFTSQLDLNIERGDIENRGTKQNPLYVPVIRYGTPVFDDFGIKRGIIVTNIYGNFFLDNFRDVSRDTSTMLVNKDGYYLLHPQAEKEWGFMLGHEEKFTTDYPRIAFDDFDDSTTFMQIYDSEKKQYLTMVKVLPGMLSDVDNDHDHFWIIVSVASEEIIASEMSIVFYRLMLIMAIITLFVLIASYYFGRSIISPIKELTNGAKIIEGGDLSHQFSVRSGNEFKHLARAFNSMTAALKKSRLAVDKRVKEQTSEITKRENYLENQQTAILNILEDVEDEKNKSEQAAQDLKKFELAVSSASDYIVITDPEGIILYANPALEKITGYSAEKTIGKKAGNSKLWGGQMSKEFYKKMWKTIKVDKKVFASEIKNKKRDGTSYIAMATISPVLDEVGEVLYFVGVERDITQAKEIDRMKTEFVSVASHQLRTPLTAIRWFIEELYDEELGKMNKGQKDYLKQALESNERMIRLVNDLLNVSRLEMGRLTIDPEPTDMVKLVDGVVVENKIIAQARNCTIIFNKPKTKLNKINLDPSVIGEVVNNLISNAVKYSNRIDGKCVVLVGLKKEQSNIVFSVTDNGVGIPRESQHRIFEKFFRADNVVRMETEGTGLGLYVAKMIVKASGGEIWFKSTTKGTVFSFSLPLSGSKVVKGERRLA